MGDVPVTQWDAERLLRDRLMRIKQNEKNRYHFNKRCKVLISTIKSKKNY